MAPPRTFDYDLLKLLIREHPGWPYAQYADRLTDDARSKDPAAPRVLPDSVRRVVSQYRDQWQEQGVSVPVRGVVHGNLMPPLGSVAPNQRMSTPLRYLREVSKERKHEEPFTDAEAVMRRQALRWEVRLRANREIVDLGEHGRVLVRPAKPGELDAKGELIDVAAWVLPGWEPLADRRTVHGRT
jgi:hypothetical protein